MAQDLRIHLQQKAQKPHRAQKFAGVYELIEIYDPNFQSGDLLKYEFHEPYKIVTMDGGHIWFNDIEKTFEKKGTFVLDVVDEDETEWGTLLNTALLANDKLIFKEIQCYGEKDEWDEIIQIHRIHQFFGEYLIVMDCNDLGGNDPSTEPAIHKKYLRIK